MHRQIPHRGPDGQGLSIDDHIGLAHRRLAIIDVNNTANQPFVYQKRYTLVYNGEIYNYKELRHELLQVGFNFETNSDTEVLAASYAYWGKDCLHKFNGMWAFLLWDNEKQILFISRDRFGIKPLYWSQRDESIYFASEPKQLRSIGFGSKASVPELSRYLYSGVIGATNETFFQGINSFPPGSYSVLKPGDDFVIHKWYSLTRPSSFTDDFAKLLVDSTELRLRSDVQVGSCLSGGLDSSAIVITASRLRQMSEGSPLQTIHARSTDLEVDESKYAQHVSDLSSSDLHILSPSAQDFWGSIRDVIRLQDEPFGSPSIFMQYFVMRHARSIGCPVMLDGQGADEVLLGYQKYLSLFILEALKSCNPLLVLKSFAHAVSSANLTPLSLLKYLFGLRLHRIRALHARKRMHFLTLPDEPLRQLYRSISKSATNTRLTQLLEIYHTSLPSLLRYEDRNSMANSVEARLPYLDYRMVESMLDLPLHSKINKGWTKLPLRKSGILPELIAYRRSKLGFNAPERTWIGMYSQEMLLQVLGSTLISQISDIDQLRSSWPHLDLREQWRLFNLAMWSDEFCVSL